MRKAIIAVVLALAAAALAQDLYGVSYIPSAQAAPKGACDTSTLGLSLVGATGWQVYASPDAGHFYNSTNDQFAGNGTLQCYYCATLSYPVVAGGSKTTQWIRCNTAFDLSPSAAGASITSTQFTSPVGAGRVYYWPNIITVTLPDAGVQDGGFAVTIEARKGIAK